MSTPATPSQTAGPLFGFALMFDGCEHAVDPGSDGAVQVQGTVLQADDEPFAYPECFLEVWNDGVWARARTDERGHFRVTICKPEPSQTPDGQPLAPYLNVTLFGRGLLKQAQTRLYFPDEVEANERDAVLRVVPESRRHTLIARRASDGLQFDINLRGDQETVFFNIGEPG
jgi:protocatechuate 3,4-dioxygenase alpha subunit